MSLDRLQSDVSHIKETMARMEKTMFNLDKALYKGNGTPAIIPTVKGNCERIADVITKTKKNTDFVVASKITIRNFRWFVGVVSSINIGGLLLIYKMFSNLVS